MQQKLLLLFFSFFTYPTLLPTSNQTTAPANQNMIPYPVLNHIARYTTNFKALAKASRDTADTINRTRTRLNLIYKPGNNRKILKRLLKKQHYITSINGTNFTDRELQIIAKNCPVLQSLDLSYSYQITDTGLEALTALINIQRLYLGFCHFITNDGLQHLAQLHNLQSLNLGRCKQITNDGLQHLARLTNLQTLILWGCWQITQENINALQQALPGCRIMLF